MLVHHEQLRTRAVCQELTEWTRTGDLVAQFFEAADVVILFQVFHKRTKIGVAQRARDADWWRYVNGRSWNICETFWPTYKPFHIRSNPNQKSVKNVQLSKRSGIFVIKIVAWVFGTGSMPLNSSFKWQIFFLNRVRQLGIVASTSSQIFNASSRWDQ